VPVAPDSPARGRSGFAADSASSAAVSARARSLPARPGSGATALPISYTSIKVIYVNISFDFA